MSNSINKVQLLGNVTADPKIKIMEGSGKTVANFSIATNRVRKDSDGNKKEQADFHNIVIRGKLAEIVEQYVTKGKKLFLSGRLQTRNWTDSDDKVHYVTEVICDEMVMLGGGSDNDDNKKHKISHDVPDDDDLPF